MEQQPNNNLSQQPFFFKKEEHEEVQIVNEELERTIINEVAIPQEIEKPNIQEEIIAPANNYDIGMSCLDYLKFKGNNPQDSFIASGINEIDAILRNGLRTGIVTEIFGPDQSCKTSIALQFALNAIFSEKGTEKVYSIYLSSTKRPHQQRMNQIIEGIRQRMGNNLSDDKINQLIDQFIDIQTPSVIQFKTFVQEELASYLTKLHKIRILVIDNIYDLASQIEDFKEKQAFLLGIMNLLKQFAHQSNSAVLIVNNVVAQISDNNLQNVFGQNTTIPALGNLWTHLLNERIQLSLLSEIKQNPPVRARQFAIRISPRLPLDSLQFIPDNFGIQVISA